MNLNKYGVACLVFLESNQALPNVITINTDSQAVLKALASRGPDQILSFLQENGAEDVEGSLLYVVRENGTAFTLN